MRQLLLLGALAFLFSSSLASGQVTIGSGTVVNGGTAFPAPYGVFRGSSRHQLLLRASELSGAGLTAGLLNQVGFDVASIAGVPELKNFSMSLGLSGSSSLLLGWQTGLTSVLSPRSWAVTTGQNVHLLDSPFMWDGTSNLVIEVCVDNTSGGAAGFNASHNATDVGFTAALYHAASSGPQCTTPFFAGTSIRPNVILNTQPGSASWQVNTPNCSLVVDGVVGSEATLPQVTLCSNSMSSLDFQSNQTATPFDIGIWAGVPLAGGAGALTTLNTNQLIHIDLASPFTLWLLGGNTFNLTTSLANSPLQFPWNFMTFAPAQAGIQAFVIDPSNADAISLSAPAQLDIVAASPVSLPAQDDFSVEVVFGTPTLCGPLTIPFYGTVYTRCFASSNGRVTFDAPDADWTAEDPDDARFDPPMVGAWMDLSPNLGGSVDFAWDGTKYLLSYSAVPAHSNPALTNSFDIELFPNGDLAVSNLPGVANTTQNLFLGLSLGYLGATNNGPTTFVLNSSGNIPNTNMIYAFGSSGSFALGINRLVFSPVGPGYSWTAQ